MSKIKLQRAKIIAILLIFSTMVVLGFSFWPKAQAQSITIFYETFSRADWRWNGSSDTSQDEPGWSTIQGSDRDTDDVRVFDQDVHAGDRPVSRGTHLVFNDSDTGAVIPNTASDLACVPINLANYTSVIIEYYWQSDDVDAGEWLEVAYSTDATDCINGNWVQIGYFENPTDDIWKRETYNLPNTAAVSTFRLRFASKSNRPDENFFVDDVKLTGAFLPATWRAAEDTPILNVNKNENIRLRIEVANQGVEAVDYDYLLEYAEKAGTNCGDDEGFIALPVTAITEHFEMTDSIYFINGEQTTPKLTVPDGYTFVNGKMVKDPSNSSGNLTLPFENYTEIEFVFQATNNAISEGRYCFRLTNVGTPLDNYSVYPELQIATTP